MTTRPVRLCKPMVLALLKGEKTQLREYTLGAPTAQPGDRLWVKEMFLPDPSADADAWDDWRCSFFEWSGCGQYLRDIPKALRTPESIFFAARPDPLQGEWKWRPSIHLPRWGSRLTLIVEDVLVERLWDMSEADARAEGCDGYIRLDDKRWCMSTPKGAALWLWDKLNPHEVRAETNPLVSVLTFRVIHANIDRIAA
jgi:hypothetical protein